MNGARTPIKVCTVVRYSRDDVIAHPNWLYVFGDNTQQYGRATARTGRRGGQAVIRGLPNAMGVPTKKRPKMGSDAFFTDDEINENVGAISAAVSAIWSRVESTPAITRVIFPADGIGTGLAQLALHAPQTARFLDSRLSVLAERLEPGSGSRLARCMHG